MVLEIVDLGLIDFYASWQIQKEGFKAVKYGYLDSILIFCRHYPVLTFGKSANSRDILADKEHLAKNKIRTYGIERGGGVTYHGPGQITVYPIFNLNFLRKDVHWFLRQLEDVIIDFLADFGVIAERHPGFTGVWVEGKKIASIGIAIKNWITYHGISINIKNNDLDKFKLIRPCGLDIEMTSLESLLGATVEINGSIKRHISSKFRDALLPKAGTLLAPSSRVSPLVPLSH